MSSACARSDSSVSARKEAPPCQVRHFKLSTSCALLRRDSRLCRCDLASGLTNISQKCSNPATTAKRIRFPYNLNRACVANRQTQHLLAQPISLIHWGSRRECIGLYDDHLCIVTLQSEQGGELALNGKAFSQCGALQRSGPGERFHFLVLHKGWKSRSSDAVCVVIGRSVHDCNYLCSQSIRQYVHKLSCCSRLSTQDEVPILTSGQNLIEKPNLFDKESLCF